MPTSDEKACRCRNPFLCPQLNATPSPQRQKHGKRCEPCQRVTGERAGLISEQRTAVPPSRPIQAASPCMAKARISGHAWRLSVRHKCPIDGVLLFLPQFPPANHMSSGTGSGVWANSSSWLSGWVLFPLPPTLVALLWGEQSAD
jgi:hypothetical protein